MLTPETIYADYARYCRDFGFSGLAFEVFDCWVLMQCLYVQDWIGNRRAFFDTHIGIRPNRNAFSSR